MTAGEVAAASAVLWLDEIDSTNAEARRRAEAGEARPLWIAALRQTGGRGRRGRAWETGVGALAATHLSLTAMPPGQAVQVAFVAALAVADLVLAHVPAPLVTLKWPNDVLVGGRKVSGVLIESGPAAGALSWIAVGVGVNLASSPRAVERPAACLADHLRDDVAAPMTPPTALAFLSEAFTRQVSVWRTEGFDAIRRAWTQRAHGLGFACVVHLGRETLSGVAQGLDASGALRLRLDDGSVRLITAGDVFFEPA